MKKILAFLLCAAMLFSLLACVPSMPPVPSASSLEEENEETKSSVGTGNSTTDSGTTNSSTQSSNNTDGTQNSGTVDSTPNSSTTSSSKNDGGSVDKPTTPTYVPDRTKYEATTVGTGDSKAVYYIKELLTFPTLTPYYNGYKTALTMTFDDGYDVNTGTVVSDQFEKYGFRGTAMLGVCFINDDGLIKGWNEVFSRGYLTLGCHGYDHKQPVGLPSSEYEHEIKDAIEFLREKFPTQRVLTFATPYAHIDDPYEDYLDELVIGNRLESGGNRVILGESFNPYRVQAMRVDKSKDISVIQSIVDSSVKSGAWTVELYHCVLEQASNGTDISRGVFEYHCSWLYRNYRDDIWFATFEDVLIYAKQLEHTSVTYTDCDRESMTFTVSPDGTLDSEIYNIPMSLTVYLPSKLCDSAYAEVNGVYQPLVVETDFETAYKYAVVKEIPVDSESQVKVYIGGNKTMQNNCIPHRYYVDEVVEPTHDTIGYTVNKCTKCETTYNSNFTSVAHDFSGEVTEVIAPTVKVPGLSKFKCLYCDEYEVREVEYTAATVETITYKGETIIAPTLTPYYHGYKSAISLTFDDGYDGNSATNLADVMEKYNMRATAMLSASFIKDKADTIDKWKNAFARGCL